MMALFPYMVMMLITGTCNTLLMKFMTMQTVPTGPGKAGTGFDQPFLQTLFMMIGELLCLFVFFATVRKGVDKLRVASQTISAPAPPNWIFLVPTCCDWTATTLVNMAYLMLPASVIQMTRGSMVIFTCAFSMAFLKRRQHCFHLVGVALVVCGITLVSLSTLLDQGHTAASVGLHAKVIGLSLCILAQIFQASMIVYEEKIMGSYTIPPLQVVGMEGLFGIGIGMILLGMVNKFGLENTPAAFYQISHSRTLLLVIIASIFSIAFFNFSGVTVTQRASATARSTLDVSRTIIIWAVELALGWHAFSKLQLAGFVLVACGTMIYNRLVVIKCLDPAPEAEALSGKQDAVEV